MIGNGEHTMLMTGDGLLDVLPTWWDFTCQHLYFVCLYSYFFWGPRKRSSRTVTCLKVTPPMLDLWVGWPPTTSKVGVTGNQTFWACARIESHGMPWYCLTLENHIHFLHMVAFQIWSETSPKQGVPSENSGNEKLIDMSVALVLIEH